MSFWTAAGCLAPALRVERILGQDGGAGSKNFSGPFPASEEFGDAVVTELGFVPRESEKKKKLRVLICMRLWELEGSARKDSA